MCHKANLVAGLTNGACFTVMIGVMILTYGCIIVSNEHFGELLGSQITSIGGGLIFVSLLYPVNAVITYFGATNHNKFLLLVNWLLLLLILSIQFLLGGLALAAAEPAYPYEFQIDCATPVTLDNAQYRKACDGYFKSEYYAGIQLVWRSYYEQSLQDSNVLGDMQDLQRNGFCCGLGPPKTCIEDPRSFPSYLPSVVLTTDQTRQPCSKEDATLYISTPVCNYKGSCPFDFPFGVCSKSRITDKSKGCAPEMHRALADRINAYANVILGITVFPLLFLFMSICLCLKRKDQDVLPPLKFATEQTNRVYASK